MAVNDGHSLRITAYWSGCEPVCECGASPGKVTTTKIAYAWYRDHLHLAPKPPPRDRLDEPMPGVVWP